MSALIIYIVASLAFILSVIFLSLVPNKSARSIILFVYLLLFISAMSYLLYKVSGQQNLLDLFNAFSSI